MSLRVLLVILALLLLGLHAGWQITQQLLQGKLWLDFTVLFIPASIGLALRIPYARSATDGLLKFLYLAIALILAAVLLYPVHIFSPPAAGLSSRAVVVVVGLITAAVLGFLHWLLFSPPFDEWLATTRDRREPAGPTDPEIPARTRG